MPGHTHTMVIGGMPGWRTTLIAAAAALLVAAIAVTISRMRAARPRTTATAA